MLLPLTRAGCRGLPAARLVLGFAGWWWFSGLVSAGASRGAAGGSRLLELDSSMALRASLARTVSGVQSTGAFQDVEHWISSDTCSSSSWSPLGKQRGKLSRSTSRVLRDLASSHGRRERLNGLVCLIRGVNGASREGADSENASNYNLSTKLDPLKKKDVSVLLSIIQEIEPLDISLISKDVSPDSTDAMKRTISGMLGLLPSDQFQVTVEAPREPLARLLVSSMMTGYTLRNGEYRLCLKRSLELPEENTEIRAERMMSDEERIMELAGFMGLDLVDPLSEDKNALESSADFDSETDFLFRPEEVELPEELGAVSPEVASYIQSLQAKLSATSKELEDCKHALTTMEMESLAGEEHNDLLDYLRSLEPEKVAELSQPTTPEVEQVINGVIDGLLSNMCMDQACNIPLYDDGDSWEDKITSDAMADVPLQFQSNVTTSRDYLARLLFWCMLLGHYMRAVEYRLELTRTLSLSGDINMGVERSR
ncbi:hypothetical protein MPTK1_2g22010 [Marchantia polymorpha subsp. ruderalis]|uniref:Uncharacterized protein n=2 Tax=Marchantia polymorpha TaxID=3197 RepID=A0A176WJ84_MARPO|nr:hypothetical protein AXG93_673s1110 [Marchantia polymorpha subsp. ruderalis]PTQ40329.1 hypothetical protein MARPO_0040s0014 [Marchantia polymorpha]BBN03248.1 hypothetical protein Mp_2g22010 [Marchantia polymorpha subsp. ruderalis]|eukprot:PTQ40329.1 hypothetical protein MARPO_0040s0014 [Marchantia polymorpha]